MARDLWQSVGLQGIIPVEEDITVLQVLKTAFTGCQREQCMLIGLYCWGLWWRRNALIWQGKNISVFGLKSMVLGMLHEWQQCQETKKQGNRGELQRVGKQWSKPQNEWVKINVDAACQNQMGRIGIGCVVRDDRGRFLRTRSTTVAGECQPREAEAMGRKEALLWVRDWRSTKCVFEMDAKLVVEALYGMGGNSHFHTIIDDCVEILKHFCEVLVVFEHRSANIVAHRLAQAAYSLSGPMEWLENAHDFILCNLLDEEF